MPERPSNGFGALAVTSFGTACALVIGLGGVAMVAEFTKVWSYYFLLEQAIATATPYVTALLGVAVVTGLVGAITA